MRNSTIKPISKKQAAKNREWSAITIDRIERLGEICEWCGGWGWRGHPWNPLEGHHMIKRRHNIHTEANCFVCHKFCHNEIEEANIKVYRGMKGVWAEGDERTDIEHGVKEV